MRWPNVRFGDIAPLVRRPVAVDPTGEYHEIGVRSFGRGTFDKPPVTGQEIGDKRIFRWATGDLIFNIVFAWEGAVAVASENEDGKFGSHRFLTCVVKPELAEARFLYWWFISDGGRERLLRASPGGAGRNRTLGVDKLANLLVPLPPLEDQRRIVGRLDRAAALVQARREAVAAAEADLQGLLTKAFHRIAADAPRLPMREVAPLVRRPVTIDLDARYPELGVRSFGRGTFHKPELKGAELSWQKLFRVEEGDLVFSNIKAWEGAFAIAGPDDHGRVGSHRYLTCVPNPRRIEGRFLWFYLQTPDGLQQVQAGSPGSADRNRTFGQQALEAIQVPVPSLEEQRWFTSVFQRVGDIRTIRAASTADIDALLPSLLNETFSERSDVA